MSAIDISVWPELPQGLEGYLRDFALVEPDCRQNQTRTNALAKPFVARHALCISYGPGHIPNSLRRSNI
jgi:hypothetical protein